MFETVAPEIFHPPSRKLWYEMLPVSVLMHVAVFMAIIAAATWKVSFPTQTPRLVAMYRLDAEPTPPPPPPPPPPAARPQQPVTQTPVSTKTEELAPTVIPDVIPQVLPEPTVPISDIDRSQEGGVEGGVFGGVIGGDVDGVQGGELGGTVGGVVVEPAPPPETVIIKRDAPLPMAPMSMVFPRYPEEARLRGWEDAVVVRYIIGKNGRVREVIVLAKPDRDVFEESTVKAIRNWRFRPLKKDGVAQEVIHELTIYFKLEA